MLHFICCMLILQQEDINSSNSSGCISLSFENTHSYYFGTSLNS